MMPRGPSTRVKDGGEFFGTSASKHNCSVHENVDFASPFVFDRTQNNQAFHVDTAAGDGRSSAIGGRARGERLNRGGSFGETPAEGRLGRSFLIGTSEAEIVTHDRAIHALRKETYNENDDRSWIRSVGIRSSAGDRVRHASSSRCPGKLFASLHGSCRIQRLRGESALCPSCGAPHRSPHRSPARPLNREDHGRRRRQVTKRVSSVSSGCRRGPAAAPESIQARLHR
jgi:hypothetical protein